MLSAGGLFGRNSLFLYILLDAAFTLIPLERILYIYIYIYIYIYVCVCVCVISVIFWGYRATYRSHQRFGQCYTEDQLGFPCFRSPLFMVLKFCKGKASNLTWLQCHYRSCQNRVEDNIRLLGPVAGAANTMTVSLQRSKTPPMSVLDMTLNNLMVRFQ